MKIQVRSGNATLVDVKGKGAIAIEIKKDPKYIHDVYLVPGLAQRLYGPKDTAILYTLKETRVCVSVLVEMHVLCVINIKIK